MNLFIYVHTWNEVTLQNTKQNKILFHLPLTIINGFRVLHLMCKIALYKNEAGFVSATSST